MSKKSQKSVLTTIRFYWRYAKEYPYTLLGLVICLPFTILFNQFLPPLILANTLRRLSLGDFIPNQPWDSFRSEIIMYAAVILFASLVMWRVVDVMVWRLEGKIQRDIARSIFNHLISQSADFHANRFSGSLVSQTNKAISSYVRLADTTWFNVIPLISSIILASVILWSQAPIYVVSLVLFSIFYISTSVFVSKPVRRKGAVHARAESKQTGYLADALTNIMAVKSFSSELFENIAYKKVTKYTHSKLMDIMSAHQRQMLYFGGLSSIISITSFALAIVSVISFNADVATVFLILSYTTNIVVQLFQFSNQGLRNYNRSIGDAAEMVKIMALEPEISDTQIPEKLRMGRGAINLNNLTFAHKDADTSIFEHLNLRIKPGEKVGLVGHSGSGKSSLVRVLQRFSDINKGEITIDGQNITKVTQADLRSVISYVPQEPLLFHRTIEENISYGKPEAQKQEILAVARKANAHDFIESLPKGYDTLVGERVVKLSGGQRQRIAIARAMLKNAPILVLDEATSALDSESEILIQDALWKLMEDRTAIVIAHRLSTIQKMDRIIVLDDGKIAEEGSHKELIHRDGVYAKLWQHQSGGFLED
ncbi:ABC transporter ATP-binding protein [Candidatus Saccharibacteria bacterium]|nr:ABC transporter ATP-binding protein [Candidatus Saccharibacteria bacterium]